MERSNQGLLMLQVFSKRFLSVVRSRQSRVIFCPNQITVSLAYEISHRDETFAKTTIIYWPDRCDVTRLLADGICCIPYSRTACTKYLLTHLLFTRIEALLPHRKLGRFITWMSHLCASTALIDDGLDTLRQEPRNVDPNKFKHGALFYTFNYGIPLGKWLERFTLVRVSSISVLAESSRIQLDLKNIRCLIVESPPLNLVEERIDLGRDDCLLVRHSNVNKRAIKNWRGRSVNGADVALEQSLKDFEGEIVVGESMVAVFALMYEHPKYRVNIYLTRDGIQNLTPLVNLIQSRSFAHLTLC